MDENEEYPMDDSETYDYPDGVDDANYEVTGCDGQDDDFANCDEPYATEDDV